MAWQNPDGLYVKFGGDYRTKFANRLREVVDHGATKQVVIDFDLTKIPTGTTSFSSDLTNDGTVDGFTNADCHLPANCSVTSAYVVMTEAATGGTSITIGTYQLDGTTISATSLMTATEGVIANMNAIGKRTYGAGALVSVSAGTAGVGVHDAYVGITTSGTYTAGKGRLVIVIVDPLADVTPVT